MPNIAYKDRTFSASSLQTIQHANAIIAEFQAQGFTLTLRQLFYQFVTRNLIPNKQSEYKRLGTIINDGRLAGYVDWDAIEDRTRNLASQPHWSGPESLIRSAETWFLTDRWQFQPYRVEVWVEKEALAGVFSEVCDELDVPLFSCRGYVSQSEMWGAAQRLRRYAQTGQEPVILHFGDHDPSGLDMTGDIERRMELFQCPVQIRRLALNMDQIEEYGPPPNPAKQTDSRFTGYQDEHGDFSWELDALEPQVLASLVRDEVLLLRDDEQWQQDTDEQEEGRALLRLARMRWDDVAEFLRNG